MYLLSFYTCDNTWLGRAKVQEFGNAEAQPVDLPPYLAPGDGPPTFVKVGDVLVARACRRSAAWAGPALSGSCRPAPAICAGYVRKCGTVPRLRR